MDYYEIGQKIRKFRKARGFSQEALAEKIGISVTHMSHIETGNTKLSLPVFVDIAEALDVQTDALLYGRTSVDSLKADRELSEIFQKCTSEQFSLIAEIAKAAYYGSNKYFT